MDSIHEGRSKLLKWYRRQPSKIRQQITKELYSLGYRIRKEKGKQILVKAETVVDDYFDVQGEYLVFNEERYNKLVKTK